MPIFDFAKKDRFFRCTFCDLVQLYVAVYMYIYRGFIPKGDRVLGYNIIVVPQQY